VWVEAWILEFLEWVLLLVATLVGLGPVLGVAELGLTVLLLGLLLLVFPGWDWGVLAACLLPGLVDGLLEFLE